jgi:hypothetical protein
MSKASLKLDWCSAKAARYAVENWHYSGRPSAQFKAVNIGAWENGKFVGCVTFGCGNNRNIGSPFGMKPTDVAELTRVALSKHENPTSRIVSIAVKMLRKRCPGLRVLVSFADTVQGHHGGIYQAMGWHYIGTPTMHCYVINGKKEHPKTLHTRYGAGGQSIPWLRANVDPKAYCLKTPGKHKYVLPLDPGAKDIVLPLAKPYPKRAGSADSGIPGNQPGGGGANPTPALSTVPAETRGVNHAAASRS